MVFELLLNSSSETFQAIRRSPSPPLLIELDAKSTPVSSGPSPLQSGVKNLKILQTFENSNDLCMREGPFNKGVKEIPIESQRKKRKGMPVLWQDTPQANMKVPIGSGLSSNAVPPQSPAVRKEENALNAAVTVAYGELNENRRTAIITIPMQ